MYKGPSGKLKPRALRVLASQELGLTIQEGEHSPVEDARAALYLYHRHRKEWERALRRPGGLAALPTAGQTRKRGTSYASRDVRNDPMAEL